MSFRPLHDRICVEPIEQEEKTSGGIIIPDTAKEKPMQGRVLAVGPGSKNDEGKVVPLDVKEGDTVVYGRWSGTEVSIDEKTVLIMRETDVMGIVE